MAAPPRAFTVDLDTGLATPTPTRSAHAFASSATVDGGQIVVTGGIANLTWASTNTIDVFTGTVGSDGTATRDTTEMSLVLHVSRSLHTTTVIPDRGVLVVGGIAFASPSDTANMQLIGVNEVIYLRR